MNNPIVIIPALNEAETISTVVQEAKACVSLVLVIDDGSTDDTRVRAEEAGAKVVSLKANTGYSNALVEGFKHALSAQYTPIVTLDADGAHDPKDIFSILSAHNEHDADITIGNRFYREALTNIPSPKWWANFFGSQLANIILGSKFHDVTCGFRAFSRRYVKTLLGFRPFPGFSFAFRSIELAFKSKFKIETTPISVRYDATDLMCTSRDELLDFLTVGIKGIVENSELKCRLEETQALVLDMLPLSIRIGGAVICMHPLPERKAYIFQNQSLYFINHNWGPLIDIDASSKKRLDEGKKHEHVIC